MLAAFIAGCDSSSGPSPGEEQDQLLRINEIQVLGTHNSYHIQPRDSILEALAIFDSQETADSLEYSALPLKEQLDRGVRQMELDIFADPEGGLYATRRGLIVVGEDPVSGIPELDEPGLKVLHVQEINFETHCFTFEACLTTLKEWSDENPDHGQFFVFENGGSSTPLVRVPWNEPYEIMKALDAGAYGVIVPMVNNAQDAAKAVDACRYPPLGSRSFGPIRGALYGGRGYAAEANEQMACIVMVETREGLDKLEEIVATPGVDGVYIGPADLALALGLPALGDTDVPEHLEEVTRILDICHQHGLPVGIHTSSLDYCQKRLAAGFEFVTLGSDAGFMTRAAAKELAAARGTAEQEREKTGY